MRFQVANVDVCGQNHDYLKLDMSLFLLDILLYKLVIADGSLSLHLSIYQCDTFTTFQHPNRPF